VCESVIAAEPVSGVRESGADAALQALFTAGIV